MTALRKADVRAGSTVEMMAGYSVTEKADLLAVPTVVKTDLARAEMKAAQTAAARVASKAAVRVASKAAQMVGS